VIGWVFKAARNLKLTTREKSELKRRSRFSRDIRRIEYEFGGAGEAEHQKPLSPFYGFPYQPTCLDDIFAGGTVTMNDSEGELFLIGYPGRISKPGLQSLFGVNRHRLGEILQGGMKKRRYNWRDFVNIMDSLLREEPREKCKEAKRGRPPQTPWLNDADLRTRVCSAIKARLKGVPVKKKIATAFLAVVDRPDLGRK
jgi:hypothetical protein